MKKENLSKKIGEKTFASFQIKLHGFKLKRAILKF